MANWSHHGWYPRTFSAREAARKRQELSSHYERRNHPQIPSEYQEMLELRTDKVAARRSTAADGLS